MSYGLVIEPDATGCTHYLNHQIKSPQDAVVLAYGNQASLFECHICWCHNNPFMLPDAEQAAFQAYHIQWAQTRAPETLHQIQVLSRSLCWIRKAGLEVPRDYTAEKQGGQTVTAVVLSYIQLYATHRATKSRHGSVSVRVPYTSGSLRYLSI